jgi:predicted secreted protein
MSTIALALATIGTQLQRGDGASPETFTTLLNVSSYKPFSLSAKVEDVTNNNTSTDPFRKKISTLLDAGGISGKFFMIPSAVNHKQVLTDFKNRVVSNWKIVYPDTGATTWEAPAFFSKLDFDAPVDGVLTGTFELTVSSAPTFPS